jgi:4-alpha-glucanotransferase
LPTAYGFLAGEPLRVRAELGLLTLTREEEARRLAGERVRLLGLLRDQGLLADQATDEETVQAMYRLLLRSPSQIVLAAPADAVGDLRQPNLPGTSNEYPNWRLPLADRAGRPVSLEEFLAAPGTARLADMLRSALSPSAPGSG